MDASSGDDPQNQLKVSSVPVFRGHPTAPAVGKSDKLGLSFAAAPFSPPYACATMIAS